MLPPQNTSTSQVHKALNCPTPSHFREKLGICIYFLDFINAAFKHSFCSVLVILSTPWRFNKKEEGKSKYNNKSCETPTSKTSLIQINQVCLDEFCTYYLITYLRWVYHPPAQSYPLVQINLSTPQANFESCNHVVQVSTAINVLSIMMQWQLKAQPRLFPFG